MTSTLYSIILVVYSNNFHLLFFNSEMIEIPRTNDPIQFRMIKPKPRSGLGYFLLLHSKPSFFVLVITQ